LEPSSSRVFDQPLAIFCGFFWPLFLGSQESVGEVGWRQFGSCLYAQPGACVADGLPEGAPLGEEFEHQVALESGEAGRRVGAQDLRLKHPVDPAFELPHPLGVRVKPFEQSLEF
jgi:hypothetical protein